MNNHMKKIVLYISSVLLVTGQSVGQTHASLPEVLNIYEDAIRSSPLIQKIHDDGIARRQEESSQLNKILTNIAENEAIDHEELHQSVVNALKNDLAVFQSIDKDIQANKYVVGEQGTTYPFRFHKMMIITEKALKLAEQENLFYEIVGGKLPQGYSLQVPYLNYFPEETHIFSTGRGNALKCLLLRTWGIQHKTTSLSQMSELFDASWLDTTPFVHMALLPDHFDHSILQSTPYYFSNTETPKALLNINNGFAFGGNRGEVKNAHDCSSLVALYTKSSAPFSTVHQAQYFQEMHGFQFEKFGNAIVKKWEDKKIKLLHDPYMQCLRNRLSPLPLHPDPKTLKPGLVHAERKYDEIEKKPEIALEGKSGHTGFFIGTLGRLLKQRRSPLLLLAN